MQRTASQDDFFGLDPSMRGPLVVSGLFHILIFLLTVIGIPFVIKEPIDLAVPISVEIVDISDVTQTDRVAVQVEKKAEEEKPAPEKIVKPTPPEIAEPPPPEISEMAPPDLDTPPVAKPIVKPAPKKPPKPAEKKKDPPKKDFQSLLKDITPVERQNAEPQKDIKDVLASTSAESQIANLGDKLTVSEMDALRQQLSRCWNVDPGAKYAENLVVEVRVFMNPDRSVQQAVILDTLRYNTDSAFRAAAESAVRAFRNPNCMPLALPPDKYNEWKTTVIVFDPREML